MSGNFLFGSCHALSEILRDIYLEEKKRSGVGKIYEQYIAC